MEDTASIAGGAEFLRWKIVKLRQELIRRDPVIRMTVVRILRVLVETLEA